MGTRAAYGFVIDEKIKITYCHFDGYPEALGANLIYDFFSIGEKELKEIAKNLIVISDDTPRSILTEDDMEAIQNYSNNKVGSEDDFWYRALREVQGDLKPYADTPPIRYMLDASDFIKDKLFCEYAYIINFETRMFEFYYDKSTPIIEISFDKLNEIQSNEDGVENLCQNLEEYISILYDEDEEVIEKEKQKLIKN